MKFGKGQSRSASGNRFSVFDNSDTSTVFGSMMDSGGFGGQSRTAGFGSGNADIGSGFGGQSRTAGFGSGNADIGSGFGGQNQTAGFGGGSTDVFNTDTFNEFEDQYFSDPCGSSEPPFNGAGFGELNDRGSGRKGMKIIAVLCVVALLFAGVSAAYFTAGVRPVRRSPAAEASQGASPVSKTGGQKPSAASKETAPPGPSDSPSQGRGGAENGTQAGRASDPGAGTENDTNSSSNTETRTPGKAEKTYSKKHGYYYTFLNDQERKAYDQLYDACEKQEREVEVDLDSIVREQNVHAAFRYDHPEFYWFNDDTEYYYLDSGKVYKIAIAVPDDAGDTLKELYRISDSIIDSIPGQYADDDYEKIKWFYEYLVENVEYGSVEGVDDQDATAALISHIAVCNGYASAFKVLCDRAGIECMLVIGDAVNIDGSVRGAHTWNLVILDGVPCWVDVTWGDPVYSGLSCWYDDWKNLNNLCATDDCFLVKHKIDPYLGNKEKTTGSLCAEYPECRDDRYCFYRLENCLVGSEQEAEMYLGRQIAAGEKTITLKFKDEETRLSTEHKLLEEGRLWEIINEQGLVYREMQFFYDEAFHTMDIELR